MNAESIQNDLARKQGESLNTLSRLALLDNQKLSHLLSSEQAQIALSVKDYEGFYELLLKL